MSRKTRLAALAGAVPALVGMTSLVTAQPATADTRACDGDKYCLLVYGNGAYVDQFYSGVGWYGVLRGHPEMIGPNNFHKNGPQGLWGAGPEPKDYYKWTIDLHQEMPAGVYCSRFWADTAAGDWVMVTQACAQVG
jgi:hypothetical protein